MIDIISIKKSELTLENIPHIPVLFNEVIEQYSDISEGYIIDCTLGYGGHTSLLLDNNPNIKVIGIDQDITAINFSKKRLEKYGDRFIAVQGRFSDKISEIINNYKIENIKAILADIGVSSLQLDQADRGFSFESEELDMRMNQDSTLSAKEVVNAYSIKELEVILREYGEIPNAKKLAHAIVDNRPYTSAKELSAKLKSSLFQGKKIHPSTLLFQAIRIEVNDELGELKRLLDAIESFESDSLRVGIISFHSLEDRIVKQRFSLWSKKCICPSEVMRCICGNDNAKGKIITKKPLIATTKEIKENPRSRSAKLRLFQMSDNAR